MNSIKLTFLLILLSTWSLFNFGQTTFQAVENTKSVGEFNEQNQRDGEWFEINTQSGDTIAYWNYKDGKLNGAFYETIIGLNFKYKFVSSKLNNYSDIKRELFLVKGNYRNDSLHGKYEEYYANGQLYMEGEYKNNLQEGPFKLYHDNGELFYLKNHKNGVLHGTWKQFYNTGLLREERELVDGKIVSSTVTEWHDNGTKMNSTSYIHVNKEKLPNGPSFSYYENGNLEQESYFENGKPNGIWKGYYETGKLKYKMVYENFVFKSNQQFDENGDVK